MPNFPGVCRECRYDCKWETLTDTCPQCGWPANHIEARMGRRKQCFLPAMVQVFLDMAQEQGRLTDAFDIVTKGRSETEQLDLLLPLVEDPSDEALRAAILDRQDVLIKRPRVTEIELKYLERLFPLENQYQQSLPGLQGPRLVGWNEIRVQTFYDTLDFGPDLSPATVSPTRLFGNANIGHLGLTNLQVSGQLASDQSFFVAEWWVSITPRRPSLRSWSGPLPRPHELVNMAEDAKTLLGDSIATFYVGDRPRQNLLISELVRERQPALWDIPNRQNFIGEISVLNVPCQDVPCCRLRLHFRGWQLRSVQ